jgi:CBS domain-containing protein
MKVREVMTSDVQVARPTDTIQAVAQQMAQLDVGSMPICDGRRIQGMVTDRDITVRGVAQGLQGDTPITQVMTGNLEYVMADDDLDQAHDKMSAAHVRRLPVIDQNQELVGIVAMADLARQDEDREVGATVQEISEARPNN